MILNLSRAHRLIETAIHRYALDLHGFQVLTEAATGYYVLTPLIAALGGAERVFALTRDSRYGKASEASSGVLELAEVWDVADRIEFLGSRNDDQIVKADIVTNLGFVRPLDASLLRRLKSTAVIPLMWETWEYRPEELDLSECQRLGIPVLGTNEHHPSLQTFKYVGQLALKLLYSLDIEVFRSNIVVIGSGEFARVTLNTLQAMEAQVTELSTGCEGTLKTRVAHEAIRAADAIIIVEHHNRRMLIGPQGEISADSLYSLNPGLSVVHICGGVDKPSLEALGLRCFPRLFAPAGYMSVATDYLGPKPLIDLHTAGLKVGEFMARARLSGYDLETINKIALEVPLAMVFQESDRKCG